MMSRTEIEQERTPLLFMPTNEPLLPRQIGAALDQPLLDLMASQLAKASTNGINAEAAALAVLVCLPLAAVSSVIYVKPNMEAGTTVASDLGLSELPVQIILTAGGVSSNFILNAYFSYSIPKTILDEARVVPWPGLPKSQLARINDRAQTVPETLLAVLRRVFGLSLKSIPVLLSTAQYVALGADGGLGPALLISQVGCYGLMHWFAVTHFVEHWVDNAASLLCCRVGSLAKEQQRTLNKNREAVFQAYKQNLENALTRLQRILQRGQRETLSEVYALLNSFIQTTDAGRRRALALQLQVELFQKVGSEQLPNIKEGGWKLVPVHLVNAALTVFCYISYHLSVWDKTPDLCKTFFGDHALCDNPYFIDPVRVITIFPLAYLAAGIVAPNNTRKLWQLIQALRQKEYVKPVIVQRYPGMVYIVVAGMGILALFSWGATVTLNQKYIPDSDVLKAANVNTIGYNAYFNAFPIPYVAMGLSVLGKALWVKTKCLFKNNEDNYLQQSLQDTALENFLLTLAEKLGYLRPENFIFELRKINNEDTLRFLLGNNSPHDLMPDIDANATWLDTLNALISPELRAHRESSGQPSRAETPDWRNCFGFFNRRRQTLEQPARELGQNNTRRCVIS